MNNPLTQAEFDRWCESDTEFKQRILRHVETQVEINLDNAAAIATLRVKQEECADLVSRRSTWLSSVVSAIIGGIIGAFSGRWS